MLYIITSLLFVGFVSGIFLAAKSHRYGDYGFFLTVIGGVLLLCLVVMWPANYFGAVSDIEGFQSVKQTIEAARARGNDWENAALQQKVIESNQWLASSQYWAGTIFEPMWPDEIHRLTPIE